MNNIIPMDNARTMIADIRLTLIRAIDIRNSMHEKFYPESPCTASDNKIPTKAMPGILEMLEDIKNQAIYLADELASINNVL